MGLINRAWNRFFPARTTGLTSPGNFQHSGNLVYGSNCNLDRLDISLHQPEQNYVNVRIGNDCHLSCRILLQSKHAQLIIGDGVFIGPDTTIFCFENIVIGNDVMISWGCTVIDTNAHSLHSAERKTDVRDWIKGPENKNWSVVAHDAVRIQDKCWIGFNSIITKGVVLGEGTVIGCGSVVTKSTQPYGIYGGNPAALIKSTD